MLLAACGARRRRHHGGRDGRQGRGRGWSRSAASRAPVYVTSPPGDRKRIFVVEQGGRIRRQAQGAGERRSSTSATQVTAGGEQGLLSIAFAPDYATSQALLRLLHRQRRRPADRRVPGAPAAAAPTPGSARLVLEMADPESNHNGGLLLFGPDGLLYVGTGDGGGGGDQHGRLGNGQNLGSLLGKLLRIDPGRGTAGALRRPGRQPVRGRGRARRDLRLRPAQPVALLLRPQDGRPRRSATSARTSTRRSTSCAAGKGARRELRLARRSRATTPTPRARRPRAHVDAGHRRSAHDDGNCSITGGVVVRDRDVPGALRPLPVRRLLQGPRSLGASSSAGRRRAPRTTGLKVEQLSSFGEDARGRVYVVSLDGPVYRLAAK